MLLLLLRGGVGVGCLLPSHARTHDMPAALSTVVSISSVKELAKAVDGFHVRVERARACAVPACGVCGSTGESDLRDLERTP